MTPPIKPSLEYFDFSRLERLYQPDTRHPFLQSMIAALTPEEAGCVRLSERSYGFESHQFPSGFTPEEYFILIACAKRVHIQAEIYLANFSFREADPACFDTVFSNLSIKAGAGLMLPLIQSTDESNKPLIDRTLLSSNCRVFTRCFEFFTFLSGREHAAT